jgi:hypothetical protein
MEAWVRIAQCLNKDACGPLPSACLDAFGHAATASLPPAAREDPDDYRRERLYTAAAEAAIAPWLEAIRALWKVFPMNNLHIKSLR